MKISVANLILHIIGNGKPCTTEDWQTISKALSEEISHNKQRTSPCTNCGSTREPISTGEMCPDCYSIF